MAGGEVVIDFCRCSIHPCDASAVDGVGFAVCVLRHKRPRPARTLNCRRVGAGELVEEGREGEVEKWPSRMPHKCSQTQRKRDTKRIITLKGATLTSRSHWR